LRIIRTHHQEKRLQLNLKNVLFHLPLIGGRFFKTSLFTAFGMLREYHNNQQFHANDREILIRLLIESKQPIKQQTLCHHGYTYLCNPNSITMKPKRISFIEKIATEHKDIALHYLQKDTITRKERNQLQGWYINHLFILFIIAFMQLNFKLGAKLLLKCLCYPIKSLHSIYFTLKKLHRNKIAF
jgi:hypothetical protein